MPQFACRSASKPHAEGTLAAVLQPTDMGNSDNLARGGTLGRA